jgi:hypothetical protein
MQPHLINCLSEKFGEEGRDKESKILYVMNRIENEAWKIWFKSRHISLFDYLFNTFQSHVVYKGM